MSERITWPIRSPLPVLIVVAAMLAMPTTGASQGGRDSASAPPRRAHHALVYDAANRRVLLIGGSTPIGEGETFKFFDDLWALDGTGWKELGATGAPRSGQAVAYDAVRNRVLSFGGYCTCGAANNGRYADLLELKGSAWENLGPATDRPAADAALVHDTRRDRFVLFGGGAGNGRTLGDMREFDGTSWTTLNIPGPPPRASFAMVFDERRGKTIVFGGRGERSPGQQSSALGDTWEYDGRSWIERRAPGPSPRTGMGVAYDSRRGLVMLFGGVAADGFKGDTWSWNGSEWKLLADSGPEPRGMGFLAYDQGRDRVVLFGGRKGWPNGDLNDTWEWDGERWQKISP